MSLLLYAHPFSSYCQKVLIAFYESSISFSLRILNADDPEAAAQLEAFWTRKRFPLLVVDRIPIPESTIIIEYLALHHPGAARLIPGQAKLALDVRLMDRFFDNYIMTPMMKIVSDFVRVPAHRDTRESLRLDRCSTRPIGGSTRGWLKENGRVAMISRSPIVPKLQHCSTPIGPTPSPTRLRPWAATASVCSPTHRLRGL
jgi:hypothetical protein